MGLRPNNLEIFHCATSKLRIHLHENRAYYVIISLSLVLNPAK